MCVSHGLLQCLCVRGMCMYMVGVPEPVYTHAGKVITHVLTRYMRVPLH